MARDRYGHITHDPDVRGIFASNYPTFDGFPMFSPDGKQHVFASNRGGKVPGETNLFVVDWVE